MIKKSMLSSLGAITLCALAGYAVGLLTASKSGREARKDLEYNSLEFCSKLKSSVEINRDAVREKLAPIFQTIWRGVLDIKDGLSHPKGTANAKLASCCFTKSP